MIYLTDEARSTALANISRLYIRLGETPLDILGHQDTVDIMHYLKVLMDAISAEQREEKRRLATARRRV